MCRALTGRDISGFSLLPTTESSIYPELPAGYKTRLTTQIAMCGILVILCLVYCGMSMFDLRRRGKRFRMIRLQQIAGANGHRLIVLNSLFLWIMLFGVSSECHEAGQRTQLSVTAATDAYNSLYSRDLDSQQMERMGHSCREGFIQALCPPLRHDLVVLYAVFVVLHLCVSKLASCVHVRMRQGSVLNASTPFFFRLLPTPHPYSNVAATIQCRSKGRGFESASWVTVAAHNASLVGFIVVYLGAIVVSLMRLIHLIIIMEEHGPELSTIALCSLSPSSRTTGTTSQTSSSAI